jgi:hypothetical protein
MRRAETRHRALFDFLRRTSNSSAETLNSVDPETPPARTLTVLDATRAVDAFAAEWGVEPEAAALALDFEMQVRVHGGCLTMDELADHARAIQRYGDGRFTPICPYCQQDIAADPPLFAEDA